MDFNFPTISMDWLTNPSEEPSTAGYLRQALPLVDWQVVPRYYEWANSWRPGEIAAKAWTASSKHVAPEQYQSFEAFMTNLGRSIGHHALPTITDSFSSNDAASYQIFGDHFEFNTEALYEAAGWGALDSMEPAERIARRDEFLTAITREYERLGVHEIVHRDQFYPFRRLPLSYLEAYLTTDSMLPEGLVERLPERALESLDDQPADKMHEWVRKLYRAHLAVEQPFIRFTGDASVTYSQRFWDHYREIWDQAVSFDGADIRPVMKLNDEIVERDSYLAQHLFENIENDEVFTHYDVVVTKTHHISPDVTDYVDRDVVSTKVPLHLQNPARVRELFTNPKGPGDYLFLAAYRLARSRMAATIFRSCELGGNIFGLYEIYQLYKVFTDDKTDGFDKGLQVGITATSIAASGLNTAALFAANGARFFKVGGPLGATAATMTASKNLYDTYKDQKSTSVEKALAWGGMVAAVASTTGALLASTNRTHLLVPCLTIGGMLTLMGFNLAQGYLKDQRLVA